MFWWGDGKMEWGRFVKQITIHRFPKSQWPKLPLEASLGSRRFTIWVKTIAIARFLTLMLIVGVAVSVLPVARAETVDQQMPIITQTTNLISDAHRKSNVKVVVVKAGDTLWSIAKSHGPRQSDPRLIIDQIKELNGLTTANLQIGQLLIVPQQ